MKKMNKLSHFNIKFLNRKESETENIVKNAAIKSAFNQFHFLPLQVVPMLHHFGVHFRDNLYKQLST